MNTKSRTRKPSGKPTCRAIEKAIRASRGLVNPAARMLGVVWRTVNNHILACDVCKQAQLDAREAILDEAENVLADKALVDKDTTSLVYLLRTVGRYRGYGDRKELDVTSGGEPLRFVVTLPTFGPEPDGEEDETDPG